MNFFLRLFRKKKIKFVGRGAMNFKSSSGEAFSVDGEFLPGDNDIIIYPKSIEYLNSNNILDEKKRETILNEVLEELEIMNLKVVVHSR